MKCPNCDHNMSDDSDFCMKCGHKVIKTAETSLILKAEKAPLQPKRICSNCGEPLDEKAAVCPCCGVRLKKSGSKKFIISIVIVAFIVIASVGIIAYKNSIKSPIDGVSKKIYEQGLDYLDEMESAAVKNATIDYVKYNKEGKLNDIYKHIDKVDFQIDLGKYPSKEEEYYSDLIIKFWESWAVCYGHEAIISEYDSDSTKMQMLTSMYKGIVSEFKDDISKAKEKLKKANDYLDMEESYEILDNIWKKNED